MIFGAILIIAFGLWCAISPRSVWKITEAWTYRHPEANEPSDIAYLISRVGGVVLIVIGGILMSIAISDSAKESQTNNANAACQPVKEALYEAWGLGATRTPAEAAEITQQVAAEFDAKVEDAAGGDYDIQAQDDAWRLSVSTIGLPDDQSLTISWLSCPGEQFGKPIRK